MNDQKIISEDSVKRVLRDYPAKDALEEIEKFLMGLKENNEARIDKKSVVLGEKVKCEFEISERDNGRKSLEIELEW